MTHDFDPPFNIETYNLGYWESVDECHDLEEALWLASSLVRYEPGLPEDRVRIIDNDNKII
jgi:hypothetical protein